MLADVFSAWLRERLPGDYELYSEAGAAAGPYGLEFEALPAQPGLFGPILQMIRERRAVLRLPDSRLYIVHRRSLRMRVGCALVAVAVAIPLFLVLGASLIMLRCLKRRPTINQLNTSLQQLANYAQDSTTCPVELSDPACFDHLAALLRQRGYGVREGG